MSKQAFINPTDVSFTIRPALIPGSPPQTGIRIDHLIADGTQITITPLRDFGSAQGSAAGGVYVTTDSMEYDIGVTLMPGRIDNETLLAILGIQQAPLSVPFGLDVVRSGGGDLFTAAFAIVKTAPTVELGAIVGPRTWTFTTGDGRWFGMGGRGVG